MHDVKSKQKPIITHHLQKVDSPKKRFEFFSRPTNTQFAAFDDLTNVYLVFRGTEGFTIPNGIADWCNNVRAMDVDFTEGAGQVHKGFYDCFRSVKADIDAYLGAQERRSRNIIVCGHSLGGAVATLAAAYIRKNLADRVMLYTFASPRAGDSAFVDYFTGTKPVIAYRVVNTGDIVPLFPPPGADIRYTMYPAALPLGGVAGLVMVSADYDGRPYMHFGKTVLLKKTGTDTASLVVDPPDDTPLFELALGDYTDWWSLTGVGLIAAAGKMIVGEHEMPNYLALLGMELKRAAGLYMEAEQAGREQAGLERLDLYVQQLKREEQRLILESYLQQGVMRPDATAVRTGPRISAAYRQKEGFAREALAVLQSRRTALERLQAHARNPDSLARYIAGRAMDGYLYREIRFQYDALCGRCRR